MPSQTPPSHKGAFVVDVVVAPRMKELSCLMFKSIHCSHSLFVVGDACLSRWHAHARMSTLLHLCTTWLTLGRNQSTTSVHSGLLCGDVVVWVGGRPGGMTVSGQRLLGPACAPLLDRPHLVYARKPGVDVWPLRPPCNAHTTCRAPTGRFKPAAGVQKMRPMSMWATWTFTWTFMGQMHCSQGPSALLWLIRRKPHQARACAMFVGRGGFCLVGGQQRCLAAWCGC